MDQVNTRQSAPNRMHKSEQAAAKPGHEITAMKRFAGRDVKFLPQRSERAENRSIRLQLYRAIKDKYGEGIANHIHTQFRLQSSEPINFRTTRLLFSKAQQLQKSDQLQSKTQNSANTPSRIGQSEYPKANAPLRTRLQNTNVIDNLLKSTTGSYIELMVKRDTPEVSLLKGVKDLLQPWLNSRDNYRTHLLNFPTDELRSSLETHILLGIKPTPNKDRVAEVVNTILETIDELRPLRSPPT